ncbi:uncharacterized protein LOC129583017 [Paramacrobiotus metropolitanus]|uniref:uncharacterized protein LOC129583017 n=1 Tax=Paramacrobiotus metropolitanus TaxID=2943436 RepID=UPI0024464509|nr:uncharacterized protein LOC129583017 [Paramacrobiotus metropolitanus]XP_055330669.1 uncharacterized protein LOC129583017 [Paramacrobiotus metropolitanus]XP_055330670.1 uncharacterized protein LOC129583017 [Paramacrobiotus metropolitanus]
MLSLMNYANSVDILGDDGLMRYGRVVDVAENGLFVDLLYPNRRREYVPFNRLFSPRETSKKDPQRTFSTEFATFHVEIHVPETPLPGLAISLGRSGSVEEYGGAIVHWRRKDNGVRCEDIIPSQRIRWPLTSALPLHRYVRSQTFVKRTVSLDTAFHALSTEKAEELIQRLNDDEVRSLPFPCEVDVVEVVDSRLGYICQPRLEASGIYDPQGLRALASLASFQAELLRLSAVDEIPATSDMPLSPQLWQQVFSNLETVTQMRLRAVCAAWNTAIGEAALRGCIVIGDCADFECNFTALLRLATLYKCLQPGTQHVMMQTGSYKHWPMSTVHVLMMCDMIHYVARHHPDIRLRSLHVSRFSLDLQINGAIGMSGSGKCALHQPDPETVAAIDERVLYKLEDFVTACCRLPCDAVHLSHCAIHLLCCYFVLRSDRWERKLIPVEIDIPTAQLPMHRDFRCALWEAMDTALPEPNEQALPGLLFWLQRYADERILKAVCTMLCALQSADPRPSAHYRGKMWCVDGLDGLQLADLSRITRHFLVQLLPDVREFW